MPDSQFAPAVRNVTDTMLGRRILDLHHLGAWPGNLFRFALFRRARDRGSVAYRAVTWDPQSRLMHVLRIVADSTPTGVGAWEKWELSGPKAALEDAYQIQDTITPVEVADPSKELPDSSLVGAERRKSIVESFCCVDTAHEGHNLRLFNPFVQTDLGERAAALTYVCKSLKQPMGYQTYVLELFYRYVYFGGVKRAMVRLTQRQGGPGASRVGINVRRPGPLTFQEEQDKMRSKITGEECSQRHGPIRPSDIVKFVFAVVTFHIEDKQSLPMTYARMVEEQYGRYPKRLLPGESRFLYYCREHILEKNDAEKRRLGPRLTEQYAKSRTGQSSWMTFGFNLEVVDVDGFVAKIPVRAMIAGKPQDVYVTIMFAVSRRTGAVVGYEIEMRHERAESFRRCIASVYMPKAERAQQLGLKNARGLLHGNIDAVFFDNAGMTKDVIATACEEMGLTQFVAPPARGDLKSVGESLNNVMVHLFLELKGAFSRQRDIFSREMRRIKAGDEAITVEQLETFLLMAIQHVNLYANKRHLRSNDMREKGVLIHPYSLWAFYQRPENRAGDQRREWDPFDIWLRFIPWRKASVRAGKMKYLGRRWSSTELKALYNEHMRRPAKTRGALSIEFKRVGPYADRLQWRADDGKIGELELVGEDKFMIGVMAWKALELRNFDDRTQVVKAAPKQSRSRALLQHKPNKKIEKVEKSRQASAETVFHGPTVPLAREAAQARRDAQRLANLQRAHGSPDGRPNDITVVGTVVEESLSIVIQPFPGSFAEQAYDDDLEARLLEIAQSQSRIALP
ncbi:hypothetical protein [Caballeronia sp. BCC1704]|uniref:hypothetical protein n=1 Tax=Caballeronia sp. BCC1704 TaxID=2676300 RepID=UPI00158E3B14|nr:hypothetical protein [Caballeronia sp. BCC1704]